MHEATVLYYIGLIYISFNTKITSTCRTPRKSVRVQTSLLTSLQWSHVYLLPRDTPHVSSFPTNSLNIGKLIPGYKIPLGW